MEEKYIHTCATLKVHTYATLKDPFVKKKYVVLHTCATLKDPLWRRSMYIHVLH